MTATDAPTSSKATGTATLVRASATAADSVTTAAGSTTAAGAPGRSNGTTANGNGKAGTNLTGSLGAPYWSHTAAAGEQLLGLLVCSSLQIQLSVLFTERSHLPLPEGDPLHRGGVRRRRRRRGRCCSLPPGSSTFASIPATIVSILSWCFVRGVSTACMSELLQCLPLCCLMDPCRLLPPPYPDHIFAPSLVGGPRLGTT